MKYIKKKVVLLYPISENQADMAQLVEQRIRNAWVTSSSLVIGSKNKKMITFRVIIFLYLNAVIAQLVEQRLPKPQVTSSSLAYRSFFAVRISHSRPRSELFGKASSSFASRASLTAQI